MKFFDFVTGRKAKYFVVIVWFLVVLLASGKAGNFEKVQTNTSESYLPGSAESLKAIQFEKKLPGGERLPGLIVYQRDSGLTTEDKAAVKANVESLNAVPLDAQVGDAVAVFAPDGKTATLAVAYEANGEDERLAKASERLTAFTDEVPEGLSAYLTGGIGYAADANEAFKSLNGTLLIGTVTIVILLLLIIYRSPFLWIVPLISVIFAEFLTRAFGTLIAESGAVVNGQSAGIMTVMVFGVGTDYALLLISRYREELMRHEDTHEAMRFALHRSVPAIVASATTVAAALFVLLLADNNGSRSLGPIAALGVLTAMLSMLTLLPALMLICGRRIFYPYVPKFQSTEHFASAGFWSKLGTRVHANPRRVWVGMIVLMGVMSLGWFSYSEGLAQNSSYIKEVDSVKGEKLIAKSLPKGATAPTVVIVKGDKAAAAQVRDKIATVPAVAGVSPKIDGENGVWRVQATLRYDPYTDQARKSIPQIRASARSVEGAEVFVGGATAIDYDSRKTAVRDNQVIIPCALVLVLLILIALLRAITLPLLLMGTVIASFFATLGVCAWVFDNVFGFPGSDPSLPLYVFIFLVALGVDYNIFLMARAREETLKVGTSEGMMRALVATGGVITSAGVVLAGTFAILGTLPLVFFAEIGFAVAFGVLFDALLVRSVLVPALVWQIGPKIWWPSALARESE